MINNYKYISPFKILISFHKLIEGLAEIAASNIDYRANYAKALLDEIKDKPEFVEGIHDLDFLDRNRELIKYLLADLFPTALTNNEIKAATIPFYDITFNYSERFKEILRGTDMSSVFSIRDMSEHHFYVINCTLILNQYYGQNIDFGKPLFFDSADDNGIIKHYRILYNADFLEIFPTEKMSPLSQDEINELVDNYDDLDLWMKAFPENSWILKGFAIMTLFDVTLESAVSHLKTNLLKPDLDKEHLTDTFQSIFRSVFNIPDLKIGMLLYDEDDDQFLKPNFNNGNLESFIILNEKEADCKNALCGCSYETLIENNTRFVIPSVTEFASKNSNDRFSLNLLNQGIESFLLAPVMKGGKLLGLLELASSKVRALNSVNASKLDLVLPFLSDTIEKNKNAMANNLEAIIQREYTAIHPSVYWKFKKEAKNYFYSNQFLQNYTFKEIVFKEVYPLYGQIDIKGSSENRNAAIIKDLKHQINQISTILETLTSENDGGTVAQKKAELQNFLVEIDQHFTNNFEQIIHYFIQTEIHPYFKTVITNKTSEDLMNSYYQDLDGKTGMFYETRKDFDDTIMSINKNLAAVLDEKQVKAQEIFPHYFERFKTDGVEHNLYIGASIAPDLNYNPQYLNDLRFWQLKTLCEMEMEHHKLKETLPYTLDVTSLILVFSSPISIRFRMDEKRFDVDGSYNARYEVVKKRIDKAFVKNSNERITQKEKITIVYSNESEEEEYLKYIEQLRRANILQDGIEKLEVEDLQGVSGLKALRVKVKHTDISLVIEARKFISNLFKERLDTKYSYHNLEHTQNVVSAVETLCEKEKIDAEMTEILLLAAWFHDAGYVQCGENHEEQSVTIALDFLNKLNVDDVLKQKVSDLILATTFKYIPKNHFEEIIKDGDNAHLAYENYPNVLGTLREEWATCNDQNYCDIDWYHLNVAFLKNHQYYTKFAQENWEGLKKINLKLIEEKLLNQA